MRNPKMAAARARAEVAMKKLPTTMRSSTMLLKLIEEPDLVKNIMRAPSLASGTFSRNMSLSASLARTLSRATSTNSTNSEGSSVASSSSKRQKSKPPPATDPNVAYALARGLEWPVSGSNFYNKKAKTLLQAACAPPPEVVKKRAEEKRAEELAMEEERRAMRVASDDDLLPWEVNRQEYVYRDSTAYRNTAYMRVY